MTPSVPNEKIDLFCRILSKIDYYHKITLSFVKIFNMNLLDRITVNPKICGGQPCIRGMRIRLSDVLDLLANGLTAVEIVEELPDLELEDIRACMSYASLRFTHPVLRAIAA